MPTPPNPLQMAQEFINAIEADPIAQREFLEANYKTATWRKVPDCEETTISSYWIHSLPIPEIEGSPEIEGYSYLLGGVWETLRGWVYLLPGQPVEYTDCDNLAEIQQLVEKIYRRWWQNANSP